MNPLRTPELPGFVAGGEPDSLLSAARGRTGWDAADDARSATWGDGASREGETMLLSPVLRRTAGTVDGAAVDEEMRDHPESLLDMLPPFAAMRRNGDRVTMVSDSMGFRQLYHSVPGAPGPAVMSSSALTAARAVDAGLDEVGLADQSLLGWQLGQRTLFTGIRKLQPGVVASLGGDGIELSAPVAQHPDPLALHDAVRQAAALLRASLNALLDDHPDAVLQLTGGLDSRLLLSAIPPSRRRGLRAMTLGVPGSADVGVASAISRRHGLVHDVRELTGLADVTAADAWELSRDAARRLDAMCDPIALAALGLAERAFPQGVRISGLGGEVARGFYYTGRVTDRSYTRQDANRLAAWRMFVNDAVEPGLLTSEFSTWARAAAEGEVHEALVAGGPEWFRATDALYLRHRMQRWAGATDTAVSALRTVINPMLEPGFIDIAMRVRPQDKAQARFLALLQMELDPELGRMPLDNRPAPAAYAHPSPWWPMRQSLSTVRRFGKKAVQRVRRGNRPPAGGELLASKVLEHWRAQPQIVEALFSLDFLDQTTLVEALAGRRELRPSSVALLVNLVEATARGGLNDV